MRLGALVCLQWLLLLDAGRGFRIAGYSSSQRPAQVVLRRLRTPPLSATMPLPLAAASAGSAISAVVSSPMYVWTMLSLASTLGIASESTKLGSMLSSPLVTMGLAMLLCNVGLLPSSSPVYSVVLKWLVPLSIPLLLLDADLKRCLKDTGTLLKAFCVGSIGTVLGTLVAYLLVPIKFAGGGGPKIAAALCARHIGGALNFVAVADILTVAPELVAAAMAADNVVVAAYFALLFLISAPERTGAVGSNSAYLPLPAAPAPTEAAKCPIPFFRSGSAEGEVAGVMLVAPAPAVDVGVVQQQQEQQQQQQQQQRREKHAFSLLGMSAALSTALIVTSLSLGLSRLSQSLVPGGISPMLLSSMLAVIAATAFPRTLSRVSKAGGVMGVLFMQLFFGVTGGQGSIATVLSYGPQLFVHTLVQIAVHFCFAVGAGRALGLPFREVVLASNANVGGPTTAAGMAQAKRWSNLVLPALLTGIFGYAIATGLGVGVYYVLLRL